MSNEDVNINWYAKKNYLLLKPIRNWAVCKAIHRRYARTMVSHRQEHIVQLQIFSSIAITFPFFCEQLLHTCPV